jgi:integral membrane protein (TIGR01906 family)
MTLSKPVQTLATWLIALAIVFVLPALNVIILMSPNLVVLQYALPGFPPAERYQPAERLQLAEESVRAILSPNTAERLAALRTSSGEPVYNEREVRHLVDVVTVMGLVRGAFVVGGLIVLGGLALARWRPEWRQPFARGAFLGPMLLAGLLVAILLVAVIDFDAFFIPFHQVFFASDTWTFAYEDSLIQFYPVQFWMNATYLVGGMTVLEAALIGAGSWLYQRRQAR